MTAAAEEPTDADDNRQQVGQSGHWASGPNRAAIRRILAAQQGTVLNGSFIVRRIRDPDPLLLVAIRDWNDRIACTALSLVAWPRWL